MSHWTDNVSPEPMEEARAFSVSTIRSYTKDVVGQLKELEGLVKEANRLGDARKVAPGALNAIMRALDGAMGLIHDAKYLAVQLDPSAHWDTTSAATHAARNIGKAYRGLSKSKYQPHGFNIAQTPAAFEALGFDGESLSESADVNAVHAEFRELLRPMKKIQNLIGYGGMNTDKQDLAKAVKALKTAVKYLYSAVAYMTPENRREGW